MASFIAAGSAYASHSLPMIPFFIFYSMFGFQRIGDLIWAAGDQRARGFLLGATYGRTTLTGEGLQHDDGHSLLLATTHPGCRAYDPAFAYETAAIVRDGLRRMHGTEQGEDVLYYVTLYNENYPQAAMPKGVSEEDVVRGLYRFREAPDGRKRNGHRAQILGSGALLQQALRAQELLAEHHDVRADVWSATSYQQLRRDAIETERWNRLHPGEARRVPLVTRLLEDAAGPVVAVSDSMRLVHDQVARWVPQPFVSLGTDGWGRSDTREELRRFFEVDAEHTVVAVLSALADMGEVKPEAVREAIERYGIDPDREMPELA
jgi:pyruvate dehydrogenase E1 component